MEIKLRTFLQRALVNRPALFDMAKSVELKLFGVQDDSLVLHRCAEENGVESLLQIGANDGIRNDPARSIIVRYSPRSLLVEPDQEAYIELEKSYRYLKRKRKNITTKNALLSGKNCRLTYYTLSDSARSDLSKSKQVAIARKAGTDRSRLVSYLRGLGFEDPEAMTSAIPIQTLSWDDVLRDFCPEMIILDTEGMDWDLLSDLDLSKHKPDIIFFEKGDSKTKKSDVIGYFEAQGYSFEELKNNAVFLKV